MVDDVTIRPATPDDLEAIAAIYDGARTFMRSVGNMKQWTNGYPTRDDSLHDIELGELYVAEGARGVAAVFCMMTRPEPTYGKIYGGAWLDGGPYATVHRIAVSDGYRGENVAGKCFDYALSEYGNVRVDTHRDNAPMRRTLEKNGFKYCGIIYLENGDERLAFQKTTDQTERDKRHDL